MTGPALRRVAVTVATAGSIVIGARAVRRWYNEYGATPPEVAMAIAGDELVPNPKLGYTRAITIDAPPAQVWPWLVQIGQGRGGMYSYDRLENLAGCDIHSATSILAEHQHLEIGDVIRSGPDTHPCWAVTQVVPGETLVLIGAGTPAEVEIPEPVEHPPSSGYAAATWQWQLAPLGNGDRTRLIVRQRLTYSPRQTLIWHVTEPINFVMEHKMLHGIKQRAETRAKPALNGTSTVTVRPARPTLDEGLVYARYLNDAADGAFRVLLGKDYDQVIGQAYLSPGHDLSYETAVFAERSGQIAGMASGYTSQQHEQSSDEPLRRAAGYRMARMAALWRLGRRTKTFIKTVADGDYYLLAVAVADQHRGAGIGTTLLDYAEDTARAAGCNRIVLDVVENNAGARRLYERRGMTVEAKSPPMLLAANSRACRMVKAL